MARPAWLGILGELKCSGGSPVADLATALGMSYMGIKQHCLKLVKMGYLETWRVPRKEVGRPEIMYRLTAKCDPLFPEAGVGLTINVLAAVRSLYGESAPEKLLFHHFQDQQKRWQPRVLKGKSLVEKATRLADLRDKEGCFSRCHYDQQQGFRISEYHHPLARIFELYPSAVAMELRVMEQLIGSRVVRRELAGRVDYEVATLGVASGGAA
jgi:predicted ArsR family transcriptional regulator